MKSICCHHDRFMLPWTYQLDRSMMLHRPGLYYRMCISSHFSVSNQILKITDLAFYRRASMFERQRRAMQPFHKSTMKGAVINIGGFPGFLAGLLAFLACLLPPVSLLLFSPSSSPRFWRHASDLLHHAVIVHVISISVYKPSTGLFCGIIAACGRLLQAYETKTIFSPVLGKLDHTIKEKFSCIINRIII